MKRKSFLVFISLCSVVMMSSFVTLSSNEVNSEQDKIILSKQGGTTRSLDLIVDGSTDHKTNVTVSLMNYTGTAIVQIIGGRTNAQYYFDVNEIGYDVISIGTLRAATYTIRIILDDVIYEGTFVKDSTGR